MLKNETVRSLMQATAMLCVSIFFVCLCFYPGTLNNDSQWQLDQADQNDYYDGHPPIMSYLWHGLNISFPATHGSANMFLLFVIVYCFSIILIAFNEKKTMLSRWLFMGTLLFFPPVLLILGAILKDSLMAVTLLLTYAILLYAERTRSKVLLLLSFIPLFIGFTTRHNSIFAVLPFCVWISLIVCDIGNIILRPILKHLLCAMMVLLLLFGLFFTKDFLTTRMIHAKNSYALQFLLAYDLVGVSLRAKENVLPSFYNTPIKPINEAFLKKIYRPYSNYYVFWPGEKGDPTLDCIWSVDKEKELIYAWFKAVIKHPKEMFYHKTEAFFSMLGIVHQEGQLKANELFSPIGITWSKIIPSSLLNGWIYLLLLTIILFFSKKLTRSQKILFYSGYVYGLSWILSTPNSEQRYFSWVIMSSTVLSVCIVFNKVNSLKTILLYHTKRMKKRTAHETNLLSER